MHQYRENDTFVAVLFLDYSSAFIVAYERLDSIEGIISKENTVSYDFRLLESYVKCYRNILEIAGIGKTLSRINYRRIAAKSFRWLKYNSVKRNMTWKV